MSQKTVEELEMFGIDVNTVYKKSANGQMSYSNCYEFDNKVFKEMPETIKDDENTL